MEELTTKQISELWFVSERHAAELCRAGRVPGAHKHGRIWLVPAGTRRPVDRRTTAGRMFENSGKTLWTER